MCVCGGGGGGPKYLYIRESLCVCVWGGGSWGVCVYLAMCFVML